MKLVTLLKKISWLEKDAAKTYKFSRRPQRFFGKRQRRRGPHSSWRDSTLAAFFGRGRSRKTRHITPWFHGVDRQPEHPRGKREVRFEQRQREQNLDADAHAMSPSQSGAGLSMPRHLEPFPAGLYCYFSTRVRRTCPRVLRSVLLSICGGKKKEKKNASYLLITPTTPTKMTLGTRKHLV